MAKMEGDLKKLKRGELVGVIATAFCAAVCVYFIICFSIARVQQLETLQLVTLITAPVLVVIGAAVAAFCNIKYGGAADRAVKKYVLDVCVENAALMHPEKNSITFGIVLDGNTVCLNANNSKEKIIFDFSGFGKLSLSRKNAVLTVIENTLCVTFCRMYERGARYSEVCYTEREGTRRKSGKVIYIIKDGVPDKRAFKIYLKNK